MREGYQNYVVNNRKHTLMSSCCR